MKLFLSILLVSFLISDICAQKGAQKAELLAYNVIFSGVTSGIGSMINAPKNVKKGKAFLTGFLSKYPLFFKTRFYLFSFKKITSTIILSNYLRRKVIEGYILFEQNKVQLIFSSNR